MIQSAIRAATAAGTNDRGACVLIVDDSVVVRAVFARMIDASDRYTVAGAVGNVDAALAFLTRVTVDFILLDIEMPGKDGLTALPDLIAAGNGAKVIIVSSSADARAAASVRALALGAAETLVKPAASALSSRFGSALLEKLDRLYDARPPLPPATFAAASRTPIAGPPEPVVNGDAYDIIAVGASTGGIHALGEVLRALPPGFRVPIVITQHLPASFMPYFAAQLAVLSGRPSEVAVDSLRIRPGRLIVAPGDAHLRCVRLSDGGAALRLSREPSSSGCMPSVDPMFASMADVYGARMLGIMLSGMGRDGADGARRVHAAGGCVVVQDEDSSVVWGMPGAVVALGIADAVLTPAAIGQLVASRRRP